MFSYLLLKCNSLLIDLQRRLMKGSTFLLFIYTAYIDNNDNDNNEFL